MSAITSQQPKTAKYYGNDGRTDTMTVEELITALNDEALEAESDRHLDVYVYRPGDGLVPLGIVRLCYVAGSPPEFVAIGQKGSPVIVLSQETA